MKRSLSATITIGWRLAHLTAVALVTLLLATGLRLAWYRHPEWSDQWRRLIDAVSLSGKVLEWHLEAGFALLCLALFYLTKVITGGRSEPAMESRQQSGRSLRSIIILFGICSASIALLSGLGMYSNLADRFFADAIVLIHSVSSAALVVVLIVVSIMMMASKLTGGRSRKRDGTVAPNSALRRGAGLSFIAAIIAATCGAVWLIPFLEKPPTLICVMQNRNVMVDGKERDLEWFGVNEIEVVVKGGSNLPGGRSRVRVKSFRNRYTVFFLIKWIDPDRSYNRHLEKTERGWIEQGTEPLSRFGENHLWEDGLAISLHKKQSGCMATCHLGGSEGLGRHYTAGDTADVWHWKAVSTDPAWQAEDGWWGENIDKVFGGSHVDNQAGGGYRSNLNREWDQPYFLPRFYGIRHWIDITARTYDSYSVEGDTFSVGALVPSVVVAPAMGDVADVRARARWRGGVWTLEMSRRIASGSPFDLPLIGEVYLSLAPFNNSRKGHAFNLRPIRLLIE